MASGDTLLIFRPQDNEPPSSDSATLDFRGQHPVLDFNDSTPNESAVFSGVMPRNYGQSGVTVNLHIALSSAESGDTDWDVSWEIVSDGTNDMDTPGFAAVQSTNTTTVPGTSGVIQIIAVTFTDGSQMDGVDVGDGFRLKVTRDGINDSASGDAELRFVELKET